MMYIQRTSGKQEAARHEASYSLVDAVGRSGHEKVVHQHTTALVPGDADVRLPRELAKLGLVPAYDSFSKLRYSRSAAA